MRDRWYGDHKDLIKWGGLLEIARQESSKHMLQVAYYRKCDWEQIEVDEKLVNIDPNVILHFRDISLVERLVGDVPIKVITEVFEEREKYLGTIRSAVQSRRE